MPKITKSKQKTDFSEDSSDFLESDSSEEDSNNSVEFDDKDSEENVEAVSSNIHQKVNNTSRREEKLSKSKVIKQSPSTNLTSQSTVLSNVQKRPLVLLNDDSDDFEEEFNPTKIMKTSSPKTSPKATSSIKAKTITAAASKRSPPSKVVQLTDIGSSNKIVNNSKTSLTKQSAPAAAPETNSIHHSKVASSTSVVVSAAHSNHGGTAVPTLSTPSAFAPLSIHAVPPLSFQGTAGAAISGGPAIIDITRGPDVPTEAAARKLISKYLNQQNRPYSAIQIYDNLHHRIVKSTVESVCDALSGGQTGAENGILCKEYGKSKLYYPDQRSKSAASDTRLVQLDAELKDLAATVLSSQQAEQTLHSSVLALYAQATDADLDQIQRQQAAHVERLRVKVAGLTGATLAPDACANAIRRHNWYRSKWIERKRAVMDLVFTLADGMEKKPTLLMDELGLITDEEMKTQVPAVMMDRK